MKPAVTTTQRLASVLLATDLREWVAERRNPADIRRSWRVIANELRRETDGAVIVTGETLRGWFKDIDDPLVCECDEPDLDGIGMCAVCKRKPFDLLRRPA